ncbi:MAG: glycosyltransferase family 1 protein [Pseudomonadales bacterium]|nr:glycosyltransferase family 1 protein [Pseudomonadales bacterium]
METTLAPQSEANQQTPNTPIFLVTIVTETYPPEMNGVSNTLSHLVTGLLNYPNLAVQVVRPRQSASDTPIQQARYEELIVSGLPIPGYDGLHFGLPCKNKLLKLWRQKVPNAIYLATEGPLGTFALKAANQLSIPTLSGFHTNFHSYIQHYRLGWAKPLVFRYLRKFHNKTAGTLVPTELQAQHLRDDGFENVQVMGRGVDIELFSPTKRDQALRKSWGLKPNDIALIHVGRIAAEKNIALLIKTFEQAREQIPEIKLIIIGEGPIYDEMKKSAHPQIILCGKKTGEELAKHYASGDIFLFPSLTDTFGNVVTEAMASGLAVVGFDYAAAQMHIHSGTSGYLVPFDDQNQFIQTIIQASAQTEQLKSIKTQARRVAKTLAWSSIVQQFKSQLESIQPGDRTDVTTDKVAIRV